MANDKKIMGLDKPNGVLEDIAAVIGYTATTALIDWFGGQSLWIPAAVSEDHVIAKVIGDIPFKHLVRSYGKRTLNLPLDYRREVSRRNRMIGAMVLKGFKTREIAQIALMTERQVFYVRVALEEAGLLPHIIVGNDFAAFIERLEGEVVAENADPA